MKKTIVLCLALLLLGALIPCAASAEETLTLLVASDPHFLAPDLTDHGAFFTSCTENSDGKLMRYSEELVDAFLAEAVAQKPEALLLTGDLTFNGELLSHTALAAKLRAAEAAGLRVLVLPGNHDLYNNSAVSFRGEGYTRVPTAAASDFRRIYADFGYDEALSADSDSLSYIVTLSDGTRVLMLDYNTLHDPCGVSDTTLKWVEEQLISAREAGARVLAAGHQNLFQHTVFRASYVIDGTERLAELFRACGVSLHLSGHLHCQHWKTERGLTEIATSSLCVSPCQYGVLTLEEDGMRYETRETDVAAWARSYGSTDANLLSFPRYAANFFDNSNLADNAELFALLGYTQEETARMTAYIAALNRACFSGNLRDAAQLDPTGEITRLFESPATIYAAYIASMQADFGMDFRKWNSE